VGILFGRFLHSAPDDDGDSYVDSLFFFHSQGAGRATICSSAAIVPRPRRSGFTMRAALAAILFVSEWPDDEMSVFATLRGARFALDDATRMREYSPCALRLSPVPRPRSGRERAYGRVADALMKLLWRLHTGRNDRPLAEDHHAAPQRHAAPVAVRAATAVEQVLANVLHVAELARLE